MNPKKYERRKKAIPIRFTKVNVKIILILPCYFNLWMVGSSIKDENLLLTFPVRGKLKYMGPSLNSLPRFFENLRKSSYKIENSGNL